MINLEWLRTFRAVYRTKSLSQASEMLNISQPTVSQQISSLEASMGQKLFTRKSKGVIETDEGRILNTLVSGSIESLEEVENLIGRKKSKLKTIINIGISAHLYKSILCPKVLELGPYVHIKFGKKDALIKDVEEGRLLYAIIPDEADTFDIINHSIADQKMVLVGTPDLNLNQIERLYKKDRNQLENFLCQQKWYAHDAASSFIKLYWLHIFDRKRPAIVPNYVIPNEYETLFQLSQGSGLSIAIEAVAKPFIRKGSLKSLELKPILFRKLSLLVSKKKAPEETTKKLLSMLRKASVS